MTLEKEKNFEQGRSEQKPEDANLARVVITNEAEMAIADVVAAANDGFEAGRVTRMDAASFMLNWYKTHAGPDALMQLRLTCSDQMTMLDKIVKKARATGDLPPQLKEFLAQHFFGEAASQQKKSKKNLKSECIIDTHVERKAS